jgi:hypothetical protein
MSVRETWRIASALVRRPSLWWTAIVVARRLVPRRWWTRRPFLPLPPRDYVRFRKEAYYGDPLAPFEADDVLKYLSWVRGWNS